MIVRISKEAEFDLANGFWFYENHESGLGNRFRESIKSDIRSLEMQGGTHPKRFGYHRMVCRKFPFSIYYQLESVGSLTVIAVFSQRRGKQWITDRLGGNAE